jgi:hypothetical protein
VLLVVLGAGASYDCLTRPIPDELFSDVQNIGSLQARPFGAVRPPLANDLVEPQSLRSLLIRRYEPCQPIVAELQRRQREGLEQVLTDISERRKDDPHLALEILAFQFYLRDLLAICGEYMQCPAFGGGITNYTHLVAQLREWARTNAAHVCFVTFNYDTLLDRALWNVAGIPLSALDPADQDEHVSLLRPHGSVAWEYRKRDEHPNRTMTRVERALEILETGLVPTVPAQIRIASEPWVPFSEARPISIPALALPLDGKVVSSLVWPPEQQAFIESLAGRVTRVLTIGWRGAEAHALPYFVSAARDKCPILVVVGGSNAENDFVEVRTNLRQLGNPSNASTRRAITEYLEGFSGLMRAGPGELNWFLHAT